MSIAPTTASQPATYASTGSGASRHADSTAAAREAVTAAGEDLKGATADFGFLFAGPKHDLQSLVAAATEESGGADFLACTTAGEFTEAGLTHDGVAAFLVSADELSHHLRFAGGMRSDPRRVARELCQDFDQLKAQALESDRLRSTTVLLTDGLAGTGEEVLQAVAEATGPFQQTVGGAAADEGGFVATGVAAGGSAGGDAAAALHVFGAQAWGVGVGHGLEPASEPMVVTRAEGNVVYELDGRPAFEVYRQHARQRGVDLTPENAGPYLIGNELGLYFFDKVAKARAPLTVGVDGSLSCAAEIAPDSTVCILDGELDKMLAAARHAAEEARENLNGAEAAGVLLFDCVCRGMILGDGFQREIDAVRSVFGDVPVAGFLTYGEIARYRGRFGGWHNSTAVVLAVPA
ncbi:MAG: FIST signal transduction protein [Thermoanaerobaculia bacterium]